MPLLVYVRNMSELHGSNDLITDICPQSYPFLSGAALSY